jgi:hypothetical protein
MIVVTQERDKIYTIALGEPELSWLTEAAKGMGMTRSTVLAAAFTKGLEHYFDMIREIEAHNNKKRNGG